jgi:hypothetical protein
MDQKLKFIARLLEDEQMAPRTVPSSRKIASKIFSCVHPLSRRRITFIRSENLAHRSTLSSYEPGRPKTGNLNYDGYNIFLCIIPIDFRKGIDRLAAICRNQLNIDPQYGTMLLFCGIRGRTIKILVYDGLENWLLQNRPSQGKFQGSLKMLRKRLP